MTTFLLPRGVQLAVIRQNASIGYITTVHIRVRSAAATRTSRQRCRLRFSNTRMLNEDCYFALLMSSVAQDCQKYVETAVGDGRCEDVGSSSAAFSKLLVMGTFAW